MLRVILPLLFVAVAAPPAGKSSSRTTFRNNLEPGRVFEYDLSRITVRTTKRPDSTEQLTYVQQAQWVLCNIDEPKHASVMQYQMVADGPARPLELFRNKERIITLPPPDQFNLPTGSTRLYGELKTARDAPLQVPHSEPVEQVLLRAMLDFAHWPAGSIGTGHRWRRPLQFEGLDAVQVLELVDFAKTRDESPPRLTLTLEGTFTAPLSRDHTFDKAQAVIIWSRLGRCLWKFEGKAAYSKRSDVGVSQNFELFVKVEQVRSRLLSEKEQDQVREQLIAFAGALKAVNDGQDKDAREICKELLRKWPGSLWTPAYQELLARATPDPSALDRFSKKQLLDALARAFIAWEAATQNRDPDLLEKARRVLERLAADYRVRLSRLARDSDEDVRARAVFAAAFGGLVEDVRVAERAAADKSAKVRSLALAGLAGARARGVDAELLLKRLDDRKAAVRRQACRAIGACVPPDHPAIEAVVSRIDRAMIHDKSDGVRLEAIRALAAIGARADIPRLEKALSHELNRENRSEIERAIGVLKQKG